VYRHDPVGVEADAYGQPVWKRTASPLLDNQTGRFVSDLGIFAFALLFHARTMAAEGVEYRENASKSYAIVFVLGALSQVDFSYYGSPVKDTYWIHGPLLAAQVLALSFALQKLEEWTDTTGVYGGPTYVAPETQKKVVEEKKEQ